MPPLTLRPGPFRSLEMSFFMKIDFLSLSKINLIPLLSYLCHLLPLILSLISLVTFRQNQQLIIILLNLLPLLLILILHKETLRHLEGQWDRDKGQASIKDFHITYPSSIVANLSTGTTLYPLCSVLSYNRLSTSYQKVILFVTQQVEPQSYSVASKDPNWIEAMNAKIKALEVNNTWFLTDLP